jgi:hypothetical protein
MGGYPDLSNHLLAVTFFSMNQIDQNTQIIKNKSIPKIISGIVATVLAIALGWSLLPSFWFWVSFEILAALLVAMGCCGEWWLHHHPAGRRKNEKDEHHRLEAKIIAMVALGVVMELFVLAHSIREGVRLERKVSEANERATSNQVQLATLNHATLKLSAQYDLSTNALAEANARLAKIKPAKERLMDLLKDIAGANASQLVEGLSSSRPVILNGIVLDAFRLHQVDDFLKNPETKNFISMKRAGNSIEAMGQTVSQQVDLTVFPSILK